jgi:CheY-like chemotaxis protein
LVRNLVEMHGGSITAYSEGPSRGSEFTVRLPVSTEMCAIDSPPPLPAPASTGRRILVVDDNLAAAKLLSQLLAMLGDHQVELAHDGESALRKAEEFHPELILLDIGLPGMNGYLVANTIRSHPVLNNVLLAALTGYGQEEDRRRSLEAGFDEHLVKPPALKDIAHLLAHPKLAAAGRDGDAAAARH